jgi:hypothetical protein
MSVLRRKDSISLCRLQPLLLQSSLCRGDLPYVELSPIILPLLRLHRCLDALRSDCAGSKRMLLNIFVVFRLIDLRHRELPRRDLIFRLLTLRQNNPPRQYSIPKR